MPGPPDDVIADGINQAETQRIEAPTTRDNYAEQLSWWWLRRMGFRLASHGVDNRPHMIASVCTKMDTALEISPTHSRECRWTVWLRSDLAHSRARFCYVRIVSTVGELASLMEAISGEPVQDVDFDAVRFAAAVSKEAEDCERRYLEYAENARWGRVPGGL